MRMCSRLFHFPCIFYRRRTVVPLVPSYLRLPAFACVLVPTLTSMHFAPRTVGCSSCRPRCRVHRPQLCACSHRRAALVCFPCSCPAHASSAAAKHLRPRRGFQGQVMTCFRLGEVSWNAFFTEGVGHRRIHGMRRSGCFIPRIPTLTGRYGGDTRPLDIGVWLGCADLAAGLENRGPFDVLNHAGR